MVFYSEVFLLHISYTHLSNRRENSQYKNIETLVAYLPIYFRTYDIDKNQRQAHFLGQIYVESDGFSTTEENLNYSKKRFYSTFPKRAQDYDADERLEQLCITPPATVNRPRLAGNAAYSDRMGNGDYLTDEGYRYRGRGFLQVTGKDNYESTGQMMGVDLVDNPDLLSDARYALLSACCFWQTNHLNTFADRNDFYGLTRAINGGEKKLPERTAITKKIMEMQKIWNGPVTTI